MKLTYLGTAAAEAIPAVWCQCPVCELARKTGGHAIRRRAGAAVSAAASAGPTLIDLPPDVWYSALTYGVSLPDVRDLFFTHSHGDHFDHFELSNRTSHVEAKRREGQDYPLNVFGTPDLIARIADLGGPMINKRELKPFEEAVTADGALTFTPLVADHDPHMLCFVYLIRENENGHYLLYAHDTGILPAQSLEFLRGKHLSAASLDCTNAMLDGEHYHMGVKADVKLRGMLKDIGAADDSTFFAVNHFSHNGFDADGKVWPVEEFEKYCAGLGFTVAYDGFSFEI